MIDKQDIKLLIKHHRIAYTLLMWLQKEAQEQPDILSPEVVEALSTRSTCEKWLRENKGDIPRKYYPKEKEWPSFISIFSSFFSTSFHIEHLTFDDELLDTDLKTGTYNSPTNVGTRKAKAQAIKYLLNSEGIRLSDSECREIVRIDELRQDIILWTYAWELDRRSKGKGKGTASHTLWRSIPSDIRKHLTDDIIWQARSNIIQYAQN